MGILAVDEDEKSEMEVIKFSDDVVWNGLPLWLLEVWLFGIEYLVRFLVLLHQFLACLLLLFLRLHQILKPIHIVIVQINVPVHLCCEQLKHLLWAVAGCPPKTCQALLPDTLLYDTAAIEVNKQELPPFGAEHHIVLVDVSVDNPNAVH